MRALLAPACGAHWKGLRGALASGGGLRGALDNGCGLRGALLVPACGVHCRCKAFCLRDSQSSPLLPFCGLKAFPVGLVGAIPIPFAAVGALPRVVAGALPLTRTRPSHGPRTRHPAMGCRHSSTAEAGALDCALCTAPLSAVGVVQRPPKRRKPCEDCHPDHVVRAGIYNVHCLRGPSWDVGAQDGGNRWPSGRGLLGVILPMTDDVLDDWADTAIDLAQDGFDATSGWGPSRSARVRWVHNGVEASYKAGDDEMHDLQFARRSRQLQAQARLFDAGALRNAVDRFCAKLAARALCAPDLRVAGALQSVIAYERVHERATLQFYEHVQRALS